MIESVLASLGAFAGLLLAVYVIRLGQGWMFGAGAVALGLLSFAGLMPSMRASFTALLWGGFAVVFAVVALRRAWVTAIAAAVLFGSIAPAVTEALNASEEQSAAAAPVPVSGAGPVSLLGLILLAGGARRSSVLLASVEEERGRNRRLRDCSGCGIAVVDASLLVTEWNPAMERHTGITRAQMLGRPLPGAAEFGGPAQVEALRLASTGVETASEEFYYSPLRDGGRRVSGVLVIAAPDRAPSAIAGETAA
jgi:PAS domain-containing protein